MTIADSLRSRIESKVLKPGERFPTERELVQEFGVARMTVRHALDILQIEGLIDRKRGRTGGTFVRAIPPTLSLTSEHGILQQLTERGFKTRVEVISLDKLEVLSHVAGTLGVEDTALVWELKGVHYVDETPISVTKVTIPVELVPDLDEHELNQPLLPLLETYGLKSVYKRENIIAATARAEEQNFWAWAALIRCCALAASSRQLMTPSSPSKKKRCAPTSPTSRLSWARILPTKRIPAPRLAPACPD